MIDPETRADDVRMAFVRNDQFGKCLTRCRVNQGSMKIDLQRFLNDTRFDVGDLHVFDISKPVRQRHARRIALTLSLNVEIGRSLQAVPRAGHLRETRRRRQQYG